MSCTLLERTVELLNTDQRSVQTIAKESGLSYSWLNNLLYAKKKVEPGVIKTVQLYEFLSGKKLEV